MATPTKVASRAAASEAGPDARPWGKSRTRTVAAVICLVAIALLFAAVARQSWNSTGEAAEVVRLEADGSAMLHPMTTLLTELVTAQSAAVRGAEVDQASVRGALTELQQADAEFGEDLRTTQRLTDLTEQVEAAFNAGETGRAAYQRYSSIVDLGLDLIRLIGDTSRLVHDQDLDSYYLMDAAITRLPNVMVYAGRAADLVALAGGTGALTGEDAVRAAVARFNVSYDAEQVNIGLTTSVDFTARSELGSNIVARLDSFRSAADAFAPPTMLHELATTVQATEMADNASRVFAAAQSLAHLLLSELEALLALRGEGLDEQRRFTVIATVAAGVLAIALLGLLALSGRGRVDDSHDEETTTGRGFAAVDWEAAVSGSGRGAPSGVAASGRAGQGARSGGHAR